ILLFCFQNALTIEYATAYTKFKTLSQLRSQSRHVYSPHALVSLYQQALQQFYAAGFHTTLE
ncbi:MAG: hypothetical protein AAFX40_17950, partial [Cyanobacteria bacterium J06639_1]